MDTLKQVRDAVADKAALQAAVAEADIVPPPMSLVAADRAPRPARTGAALHQGRVELPAGNSRCAAGGNPRRPRAGADRAWRRTGRAIAAEPPPALVRADDGNGGRPGRARKPYRDVLMEEAMLRRPGPPGRGVAQAAEPGAAAGLQGRGGRGRVVRARPGDPAGAWRACPTP